MSIAAPGALRSVIGAALYVTVAGMIGVALGALFRNTAAGIATFAGVFFVIPPLTGLLPASISDHLSQYLPSSAGDGVSGAGRGASPTRCLRGPGSRCYAGTPSSSSRPRPCGCDASTPDRGSAGGE